jgi:hypothetical protein
MSYYNEAFKIFPQSTNEKYELYVRFSSKVNVEQLAKELRRKVGDFGTDRNNSLSASWLFKNRNKNFMLTLKHAIKKDPEIREVQIRRII